MGQRFSFSLSESLLAEVAGVPMMALHTDPAAMVRAAEAAAPVARRLGVDPPRPHLAGLTYPHVSTVGCELTFSPDLEEPGCKPCIRSSEDIDRLREPGDYLASGIVPERLELARQLKARAPDASDHIGHDFEGPITTAGLMMGPDFFMLPYDDPARAHRLLDFCVRSSLHYCRAIREHRGRRFSGRDDGMPDDFAGLFGPEQFSEFVVPYWQRMYEGLGATRRRLHSELLREEHLRFLTELKIDEYDPSVNQYLTPEILRDSCPVPFTLRMWPGEVMAYSAGELTEMYRHRASFSPTSITFSLRSLAEEPKIKALLDVARELA